ncbi:MAG: sporulation protein YqfD [Clostridia bacterium]|nr:sporulation protein YqfD [Clostridia bacterium]
MRGCGIHLKGTNVIIEIVEADKKPEIIDENEYCNIITKSDGVITKINVQNGTALVKVGDVVKNGNIIVGGWLEGKYTGTRYVHAKADVQARVWHSKKEKMSLIQEVEEETGNVKKSYGININNFKINFPKSIPNFENYDTINENKKLKIFSNFYFPIEICKTTYKEIQKKSVNYSPEAAKEILLKKLEEELKNEIKDEQNIVNTRVNYKEEEGSITVELIYEVLENIGTNEKIVF